MRHRQRILEGMHQQSHPWTGANGIGVRQLPVHPFRPLSQGYAEDGKWNEAPPGPLLKASERAARVFGQDSTDRQPASALLFSSQDRSSRPSSYGDAIQDGDYDGLQRTKRLKQHSYPYADTRVLYDHDVREGKRELALTAPEMDHATKGLQTESGLERLTNQRRESIVGSRTTSLNSSRMDERTKGSIIRWSRTHLQAISRSADDWTSRFALANMMRHIFQIITKNELPTAEWLDEVIEVLEEDAMKFTPKETTSPITEIDKESSVGLQQPDEHNAA